MHSQVSPVIPAKSLPRTTIRGRNPESPISREYGLVTPNWYKKVLAELYDPFALSSVTPRTRGHAGVSVTAVWLRGSTFGLSLSKALLSPLPSWERARVRVMPQLRRGQLLRSSVTSRAGAVQVEATASQSILSLHSVISVPSVVNPFRPEQLLGSLAPLSPSKGNSWFDKLTMNDFADLSHTPKSFECSNRR